jgi:hypothetical protein
MQPQEDDRGAHLVDSVALDSAQTVFRTSSDIIGPWLLLHRAQPR